MGAVPTPARYWAVSQDGKLLRTMGHGGGRISTPDLTIEVALICPYGQE